MLESLLGRLREDAFALTTGWRARARAAGVHALLSIAIATALLLLVLASAYPAPYFFASGGLWLIGVLFAVDVVIGPSLTLFVFDAAKPRRALRRDLCAIVVLQIAALAYGLHSLWLARPVFLTFVVDRFELVAAAEIDDAEMSAAPEALRRLPWGGPVLAGVLRPTESAERERLMFAAIHGVDLRHLLSRYVPYERVAQDAVRASRPLSELSRYNETDVVERALGGLERGQRDAARWLPVMAKREDQVAMIDGASGRLLRVVRLAPW